MLNQVNFFFIFIILLTQIQSYELLNMGLQCRDFFSKEDCGSCLYFWAEKENDDKIEWIMNALQLQLQETDDQKLDEQKYIAERKNELLNRVDLLKMHKYY